MVVAAHKFNAMIPSKGFVFEKRYLCSDFFFVNLLPWQSSIFCLCSLSGASQNNKFLLFAFKLNSVLQANLVAKAAR